MGGVSQISDFDAERAAWFPTGRTVWLQTKVPEQEHSSMFGVLFVFDHAA